MLSPKTTVTLRTANNTSACLTLKSTSSIKTFVHADMIQTKLSLTRSSRLKKMIPIASRVHLSLVNAISNVKLMQSKTEHLDQTAFSMSISLIMTTETSLHEESTNSSTDTVKSVPPSTTEMVT